MSQQPQSAPDGIADVHSTRVTRYSHWEFHANGTTTHWSMKRRATMAEAAQQEQKEAEALAEKAQR